MLVGSGTNCHRKFLYLVLDYSEHAFGTVFIIAYCCFSLSALTIIIHVINFYLYKIEILIYFLLQNKKEKLIS